MKVKIKKLHRDAVVPVYGTPGAACFDLYALESGIVPQRGAQVFATGLSFEIPPGHAMLIFSRSGHGFDKQIRLANAVGVIDSDFRGEVRVKLTNDGSNPRICEGRIAQALVLPVEQVQFELVDELSTTERGTGGFGSTGA